MKLYFLYIITFLIFPFVGRFYAQVFSFSNQKKIWKGVVLFYLLHNLLFLLGWSLKGDWVDYLIFSSEFLVLSVSVFWFKDSKSNLVLLFRYTGLIIIGLGLLQGIFGILFFLVASQQFETDRLYKFQFKEKSFETIRYSFGFVTLDSIKYTFVTYRVYDYFLIEHKVHSVELLDTLEILNFNGSSFRIGIVEQNLVDSIYFQSDAKRISWPVE